MEVAELGVVAQVAHPGPKREGLSASRRRASGLVLFHVLGTDHFRVFELSLDPPPSLLLTAEEEPPRVGVEARLRQDGQGLGWGGGARSSSKIPGNRR